MMFRKSGLFFSVLCMMGCLVSESVAATVQPGQQMPSGMSTDQQIDAQIKKLELRKKQLESRAEYHGRQAYRLQFIDFFTYQDELRIQQQLQGQAAEVQKQIDALKAKKAAHY